MPKYIISILSLFLISIPAVALASGPFVEGTGLGNPFYLIPPYVSAYSAPAFADIDADGDLDAFITRNGTVSYYQNTGNNHIPSFIERTDSANPLAEVDSSAVFLSLALADVDADHDLDAFIGTGFGEVLYFENTGTPQTPAFVEHTGSANPLSAVDLFDKATPTLADMDADGDLDIFIGEHGDSIHYYENNGSPQTPHFVERTGNANPLDGVVISGFLNGPTAPALVDLDKDGDRDAFIGSLVGAIYYYENTGSAPHPVFVERTGSANPLDFIGTNVVDKSLVTFADLNGDGDFDCFMAGDDFRSGEDYHRLHFYENIGSAQNPTFTKPAHPTNPLGGF